MEKQDKHLLESIANLATTAKVDGWKVEYDADLDSFYWTRPVISLTAKLTKLSDDFALYMTPDGNIEGIFIEYAKNNFIVHNESLRPVFDGLEKIDDDKYTLSEDNQNKLGGLLDLMAEKVANNAVSEVLKNDIRLEQVFG